MDKAPLSFLHHCTLRSADPPRALGVLTMTEQLLRCAALLGRNSETLMVGDIIHHFLCVWSGWATSAPLQPQQHLDCCCGGINNLPSVVCLDPSFVSRSYCDLSTDSFLFYFKSFPAFGADKVRFSLCCTSLLKAFSLSGFISLSECVLVWHLLCRSHIVLPLGVALVVLNW